MNTTDRLTAYLSRLSADHEYDVFADICRAARRRNPSLGIGGVLLFDGERFFGSMRGPAPAVGRMMDIIRADPRHVDLALLCTLDLPAEVAGAWRCGFMDATELDALVHSPPAEDHDWPQWIARAIARADLDAS